MQQVLDMAKAHLQNVSAKIEELENQKQILQSEIDKLKNYFNSGLTYVESFAATLETKEN